MNDKQPAMAKKGWLEKMRDLYGLMGNYTHCIWWFKCGWWGFSPLKLLVSLTRTAKPNWSNNWPTNQWMVLFNLKLCKEMQLSWQRNQGTTSCGIMGIFQQSSEVTQSYISSSPLAIDILIKTLPWFWCISLPSRNPCCFLHPPTIPCSTFKIHDIQVCLCSHWLIPWHRVFFNAPYM